MQTMIVGTLSITTQDTQFTNGYTAGYERYMQVYRHSAMSDNGVYTFLIKTLTDITKQDRYHAGYITGWYAALFQYSLDDAMLMVLQEGD